jgi:hypothetical protein
MVMTELKAEDIIRPMTFAKHAAEKSTIKYSKSMPLNSSKVLPTIAKVKVWMAEIPKSIETFDVR